MSTIDFSIPNVICWACMSTAQKLILYSTVGSVYHHPLPFIIICFDSLSFSQNRRLLIPVWPIAFSTQFLKNDCPLVKDRWSGWKWTMVSTRCTGKVWRVAKSSFTITLPPMKTAIAILHQKRPCSSQVVAPWRKAVIHRQETDVFSRQPQAAWQDSLLLLCEISSLVSSPMIFHKHFVGRTTNRLLPYQYPKIYPNPFLRWSEKEPTHSRKLSERKYTVNRSRLACFLTISMNRYYFQGQEEVFNIKDCPKFPTMMPFILLVFQTKMLAKIASVNVIYIISLCSHWKGENGPRTKKDRVSSNWLSMPCQYSDEQSQLQLESYKGKHILYRCIHYLIWNLLPTDYCTYTVAIFYILP